MSAVSLEYPIPQKFKEQGTEAIKKYLAIRTEKIELHNRSIKEYKSFIFNECKYNNLIGNKLLSLKDD